jgi:hypothetical protein
MSSPLPVHACKIYTPSSFFFKKNIRYTLINPFLALTACSFRWFIVAESIIRWFVVREKHCWMTANSAE